MKDDAISRQAVLKLLHAIPPEEAMTKAMLIQSVKQMSTAQPECAKDFVMLKVIDLNGRPYYSIIYLENGNEFEGYSSYDLKVISEYLKRYFGFAQPERKRGKWVFYEDRAPVWDIAGEKTWAREYKCSECGFVHSVIEDFGQYTFCPNCGADMRGETDE